LEHIETRIHFIHGSEDGLISIDNIRRLVDQKESGTLHTVKGAGNWIFGKYTRQSMSIIRDIIDDRL